MLETGGTTSGYGSFAGGSGCTAGSSRGAAGGASRAGEVITAVQWGQGAVVGGRVLGIRIFPSQ